MNLERRLHANTYNKQQRGLWNQHANLQYFPSLAKYIIAEHHRSGQNGRQIV